MSTELNSVNTKQEIEVDAEKRAFMKKCGKYAAVGAGMATLMTPTSVLQSGNYGSTTHSSGCNNGWGNGDDCAPGKSLFHNQAENNHRYPR